MRHSEWVWWWFIGNMNWFLIFEENYEIVWGDLDLYARNLLRLRGLIFYDLNFTPLNEVDTENERNPSSDIFLETFGCSVNLESPNQS